MSNPYHSDIALPVNEELAQAVPGLERRAQVPVCMCVEKNANPHPHASTVTLQP